MTWLVDGSNVLGHGRTDVDRKRRLVQALARFARAKRTKIICTFDGDEPEHFGRHLGAVTVLFSGGKPADDLIAKRVASGSGWKVVTSDRGLGGRVRRREVEVVEPRVLLHELENLASSEELPAEDWAAYFSDPKNRTDF